MAKYNYDKSVLKGYGVGPFLGEVKEREAHIAAAPAEEIKSIFNANIIAKKLHPSVVFAKVAKVEEQPLAKVYTLVADKKKGTEELPYFRAGQYVSVALFMENGEFISKPYTLAGNPKDAIGENSSYRIMVKDAVNPHASEFIHKNWKVGTEVVLGTPVGDFYHNGLRDAKKVVAASGGSGITPFISMAHAIAEGIEDFEMTLLCGHKNWEEIAFRDELEELVKKCNGKFKVVHVLSEAEHDGCEKGFITADLIKKYAGNDDYSLLICGNRAFYDHMDTVVAELGLPRRRARFELRGEFGAPSNDPAYKGDESATYKLKVWVKDEAHELECKASEPLIVAIQKAGIGLTTDCRSGICGWCHSRLICGNVFIPESVDGRREADKKFGWIHPCATYPLSDIEMEVFPSF